MLFDWLVVGQVMETNPAHSVRAPKYSIKKGKTSVLSSEETRAEDYFQQGRRWWVRLHEKGGKLHTMPCHHNLEQYLADLVASDANVFAYLADVSGHGIPAGVLMGMVKTAVRQGLLFHQSLPELLDGMNRVLPAVKEPHMYATLAGLQFHGAGEAEYTAAGHPPLLHYRRSENDVVRRGMEQFPLGLFLSATYASGRVPCGPGDLFALVTDGIVETTDAQEEEFGLDRLAQLVSRLAARPLPEIFETVLAAVARHGAQRDDRTLLLVRVLG